MGGHISIGDKAGFNIVSRGCDFVLHQRFSDGCFYGTNSEADRVFEKEGAQDIPGFMGSYALYAFAAIAFYATDRAGLDRIYQMVFDADDRGGLYTGFSQGIWSREHQWRTLDGHGGSAVLHIDCDILELYQKKL